MKKLIIIGLFISANLAHAASRPFRDSYEAKHDDDSYEAKDNSSSSDGETLLQSLNRLSIFGGIRNPYGYRNRNGAILILRPMNAPSEPSSRPLSPYYDSDEPQSSGPVSPFRAPSRFSWGRATTMITPVGQKSVPVTPRHSDSDSVSSALDAEQPGLTPLGFSNRSSSARQSSRVATVLLTPLDAALSDYDSSVDSVSDSASDSDQPGLPRFTRLVPGRAIRPIREEAKSGYNSDCSSVGE